MTSLQARGHATSSDVLVVGGGLVGLCCAVALAERGASVIILSRHLPGEASPAAAGMLAPGVERSEGAAHAFALAARDLYPGFLDQLATHTGMVVPLNRRGILDLRAETERSGRSLDAAELEALEPELAHAGIARLHEHDGAVDNVRLLAALARRIAQLSSVRIEEALADELSLESASVRVIAATGARFEAPRAILAPGAWVSWLRNLPGPVPVEPVRGQMLALASRALTHVVIGRGAYLVPRGDELLVGSTMEHVGLEVGTTQEALDQLRRAAVEICPALADAKVTRAWSGLRPVTPDLLPILGPHRADPRLLLACGHSRNGILLAPLTGGCLAKLAMGVEPGHDLAPFVLERFD